ncbi:GNAT family N-acetyltransferase [Neobacillus sp. SM06]|uniref:GNAT family N-acetyltransferase n=1 Tax=Neobacillus sp. SM06 TaxID=3422492 RepID=UPI003D2B3000
MAKWSNHGFTIYTDKELLDLETIHRFLSEDSYWAKGISFEKVSSSIDHSAICFGLYEGDPKNGEAKQVGFARVITDFVRMGWIMDVFILKEYRGRGLSKWLMEVLTKRSELGQVGKLMLSTFDAHGLYTQYGFEVIKDPEHYMKLIR